MKQLKLLLLLSLQISTANVQGCNFTDALGDPASGWYDSGPATGYYYYNYQLLAKYFLSTYPQFALPFTITCNGSSTVNNLDVFVTTSTLSICNRAALTDNNGAILVGLATTSNTDPSSCNALFTTPCFTSGTCTAIWRPRVNSISSPNASLAFPSSALPCPVPVGSYSLSYQTGSTPTACPSVMATVAGSTISLPSCSYTMPGRATSLSSASILTCLGNVSGLAMNPSDPANLPVVLLSSSDGNNLYCAQYQVSSTGVVNLTLDVSGASGDKIICGFYNTSSVFLTVLLSPPSTTASTTVSTTASTASSTTASTTASTTPSTTSTSTASGSPSGGSSAGGGSSTVNPLASGGAACISNCTNTPDDRVIKGVLIGVLVGSAVIAGILGLVLCCARGPMEMSGAAAESAPKNTFFDGNTLVADSVEVVGNRPMTYPEARQTHRSARPVLVNHPQVQPGDAATMISTFNYPDVPLRPVSTGYTSGGGGVYAVTSSSIPAK